MARNDAMPPCGAVGIWRSETGFFAQGPIALLVMLSSNLEFRLERILGGKSEIRTLANFEPSIGRTLRYSKWCSSAHLRQPVHGWTFVSKYNSGCAVDR